MPSWATAAISAAPWAGVSIVAILVFGRIVDKILDIVKIRALESVQSQLIVDRHKDGELVWAWPEPSPRTPVEDLPQVSKRPHTNDQDPSARSG